MDGVADGDLAIEVDIAGIVTANREIALKYDQAVLINDICILVENGDAQSRSRDCLRAGQFREDGIGHIQYDHISGITVNSYAEVVCFILGVGSKAVSAAHAAQPTNGAFRCHRGPSKASTSRLGAAFPPNSNTPSQRESVEQKMLGRCRTPEVRIVGLELAHAGVRSGFQAPRQSAFEAS